MRLALDTIAEKEGIEVDELQVDKEVAAATEGKKTKADEIERFRISIRRQLLRQGALNRMIEIARGEE